MIYNPSVPKSRADSSSLLLAIRARCSDASAQDARVCALSLRHFFTCPRSYDSFAQALQHHSSLPVDRANSTSW